MKQNAPLRAGRFVLGEEKIDLSVFSRKKSFGPCNWRCEHMTAHTIVHARDLPAFRTIRLGLLKSGNAYLGALREAGSRTTMQAQAMLSTLACASTEVEVDLVAAELAELGFSRGACNKELLSLLPRGYEFCPAEVGPALRLDYTDQPQGEELVVFMEPVKVQVRPRTANPDDLRFFSVSTDKSRWLHGGGGHPDDFWGSNTRLV